MTGIPAETRVLVDARWLGQGGAGRATEYLLRGLQELQPSGRWILWGTEEVRRYAWPGATVRITNRSPRWVQSQLSIPFIPAHDVAVYMHQVRPLRLGRSVTLFHDTIQLRFGSSGWKRFVKHFSHRLVAALSSSIFTVSQYSLDTIKHDLGISGEKLSVVQYPVDSAFVNRVLALRETLPHVDRILYVGQYAQHKNLERLIAAFGHTEFAAQGGELLLVGGSESWAPRLRRVAELTSRDARVSIRGPVSQDELEELYATSRVLAMPSLEEGFGLPAWEAMSIGLPLCVSTAGSLPEITAGRATLCNPVSVPAIARALDEAATTAWRDGMAGSTVADFAHHFVSEVSRVAGSSNQS